jgi:hypothetical protein
VLLCLAGYVLAYAGITDKATQRKLNVINVSLFTPALLFSKVGFKRLIWESMLISGRILPHPFKAQGDVDHPSRVSCLSHAWRLRS